MNKTREAAYSYHGEDKSLKEFLADLPISHVSRDRVATSISVLEASDPEKLSALGITLADEKATSGDRNFFIPEGYDQVVNLLAKDLDVRLSHEVTHIEWSKGAVAVECKDGEVFKARACVITLSLGVMKENPPSITPNLGERFWNAVRRIGFGNNTKPVLWITGDIPKFQLLSTRFGFNFWQRKSGDETMLVGYSGGSNATRLSSMPEEDVLNEVITALEDALDPGIRARITHARHFTWSSNPFVRGSYSYPTVGMGNARTVLGQPIQDTVYYSGEAIHDKGEAATVHGAIEAGRMTADRILNAS